jgi:hypothetical protein
MGQDRKTGTMGPGPDAFASRSSLSKIGPLRLTTPRGEVELDEVQGLTTSNLTRDGEDLSRIAVVVYQPGPSSRTPGKGLFVQLDPHAARSIGASLLKLADMVDPRGTN